MNANAIANEVLFLGSGILLFVFISCADLKPRTRAFLSPIFAVSVIAAVYIHFGGNDVVPSIAAGITWMSVTLASVWICTKLQHVIHRVDAHRRLKKSHASVSTRH